MFRCVTRVRVYCEYAKTEADFELFELPSHKEARASVNLMDVRVKFG